jgi:FkbM family methyltransferase
MNLSIPRILNFIGYRIVNAGTVFNNLALKMDTIHKYSEEEYARYKREDPTEECRVNYPLHNNSLVVDVGGLTGDWAIRVFCRHACNIDIYEPHPVLVRKARNNFSGNPKVKIYDYGIGGENGILTLYGDSFNASIFKNDTGGKTQVQIVKAFDAFRKYEHIDLLKINVEGAEYEIMNDLLDNYDMRKIDNLQIQFHGNVPGYAAMREEIRSRLIRTHHMTWNYDYIFENWSLNKVI